MDGPPVAVPDTLHWVSDGQQLAFLEWQGDQPREPAPLSACCGTGCRRGARRPLLRIHADRYCRGVSCVRRDSAVGVLMEQGATAPHGVGHKKQWMYVLCDRSVAGE